PPSQESAMDKPIPDAVRGLRIAIDAATGPRITMHVTRARELLKILTAAQQQGQAVACCTMIDYFNARACDTCSQRVESFAFKRAAPPSAPVAVDAAKHWHALYRKECQLRQDDAARYGQQIVDLEALAQQPAATEGVQAGEAKAAARELLDARVIDSLINANQEIHAAASELAGCLAAAVAAGATDIPLTHRAGMALKRHESLTE